MKNKIINQQHEDIDFDDWDDEFEDCYNGPTGHGDICMSDADPGL